MQFIYSVLQGSGIKKGYRFIYLVDIKKVKDLWVDIKKKVRFMGRYKKRLDLWIDVFKKVRFIGRYYNIFVKVIKIKNIFDCLN